MGSTQQVLAVLVLHIALAHSFSWDIVVARSNKLEFYYEGTLAHTAAPASHRIKWIIYDPARDRVLFADTRSKMTAASFDIATNIMQPLIMKKTKRYFKKFAYDPATDLLFGTRVNKIYSFSIKSGNKNRVTRNGDLVIDLGSSAPHELAVDSCGGYIYWIASNAIERAPFNGSDREVVIGKGLAVKQGLTIDTQKIYWIESQEYNEGGFSVESADLNGNNRRTLYGEVESDLIPEKLIVSKNFVSWRDNIETAFVWQFPKNPSNDTNVKPKKMSITSTSNCSYGFQDIATNYNIEERIQFVPSCHALKSLIPGYTDCVYGRKVIGESRCECSQGYIGERCDVSVCHNYCYQGDCDVTAGGQPKCRCNAGYSGERCEVSPCHDYCLNSGTCSLTKHSEPLCDCTGPYKGERCEVPICKDYCFQGECSVSAEGQPKCRCGTGYSGERCEVSPCHDYCLNNGTCSLTNYSKPLCNCAGPYAGERCEVPICENYCFQGECTVSAEGQPRCRCGAGYSGERCEVSPCHDYCLNNGTCSLTKYSKPLCNCAGPYAGERCEVPICKDYCFQGECSVSAEGQPKCRCNAGYTGERCHILICENYCFQGECTVSAEGQPRCRCGTGYSGERCEVSPCHDYCLNNGTCSLSSYSEPLCHCTGPYAGEKCEVHICKDYCFQGECSVSAEGQPKCRCDAGYSGERCEVDPCDDYCLNNGTCSLSNYSEPVCDCMDTTPSYTTSMCACSVSTEGQPKCRCDAGYSGERCEVSPCDDYCLNNGTCSLSDYSEPLCNCTEPYEGDRCEVSSDILEPVSVPNMYQDKFHWLPIVDGILPPNAIIGGYEEGEDTYVARANHTSGALCPGKYVPSHGIGYIAWGWLEYNQSKESIEILCGTNTKWVMTDPIRNNLPENAFIGGSVELYDNYAEPLYIGRTWIGDDLVVGKVQLKYNSCYLPYHGEEKIVHSCEILVEPDDEMYRLSTSGGI